MTTMTIPYILQREKARLERLLAEGLPAAYKGDWETFWYDFYPDFSWFQPIPQLQACLDSPEWRWLAAQIKLKYRVDFVAEITAGIIGILAQEAIDEQYYRDNH